jgi:hypothetical protein
MNEADEHEENFTPPSNRMIKIRTAHEVMTLGTT